MSARGQTRSSDYSMFINDRSLMSPFHAGINTDEKKWCETFPGTPQRLKDIAAATGTPGGYEQRVREMLAKQKQNSP